MLLTKNKESYRLDQPLSKSGSRRKGGSSNDSFGRFAESFARTMGTSAFLIGMTVLILVWISWNTLAPSSLVFDKPWFILLNLLFSTQASYAAPLILLAQNRQDERDRIAIEQDRVRDKRNLEDTEFLAREVADIRISLRNVPSRDNLKSEISRNSEDKILPILDTILTRLDEIENSLNK